MWVKFDDSMPDDPDVDRLTHGAFRLYVAAICYAQKHLTDGFVDADRVTRLMRQYRPTYLTELVTVGLFSDSLPDGYTIRNFTKWNKTRAHWKREKEKAAQRKAKWKEGQNA